MIIIRNRGQSIHCTFFENKLCFCIVNCHSLFEQIGSFETEGNWDSMVICVSIIEINELGAISAQKSVANSDILRSTIFTPSFRLTRSVQE